MADLLQVSDLEAAKKHDTFHSEVITGKAGGVAGGADIEFATNQVTGQVQKTLPEIVNNLDWTPVGLFADGVTFTKITDFAIDANGTQWIYTGTYPFTATAGTVPSEPLYQAVRSNSLQHLSGLTEPSDLDQVHVRTFANVAAMLSFNGFQEGNTCQAYTNGILSTFLAVESSIRFGYQVGDVYLQLVEDDGDIRRYGELNTTNSTSIAQSAIDDVNKLLNPQGVTVKLVDVVLRSGTQVKNRGVIELVDNSSEWARVFTNLDKENGNTFTIDNTGGVLDGNRDNQTEIQHFGFFVNCVDCQVFGGVFTKNSAPEVEPTTSHPDGPFNQGVPYGETSAVNPTIAFFSFTGGKGNVVRDFTLLDWAQEGIAHRWSEGSVVDNFTAVNGPKTNNQYYSHVDYGSRAGITSVSVGDHVLVQEGHEFGGNEQQPHLIYSALIAGSYDLNAEDYTNAARWGLVVRDITGDLGYTAARASGAKGKSNTISNGYAAFCRASSFSNDSELMHNSNLTSYHNAYFAGLNFGHVNTPPSNTLATNIVAINSGWLGGVGSNSFGINFVGGTTGARVNGFYVCGAGRNGVNQSDTAKDNYLSNGVVKFSKAGGIKTNNADIICDNVKSQYNVGDDFEPAGTSVIGLSNCQDSRGFVFSNERVIQTARTEQPVRTMYGETGVRRESFRSVFSVSAGQPVATINTIGTPSSDGMLVTLTYCERNSGSGSITNQFAVKATFIVVGTGVNRGVHMLKQDYSQGRQLRAVWDTAGVLSIFMQDTTPSDVQVLPNQNSLLVEVQNSNVSYTIGIA